MAHPIIKAEVLKTKNETTEHLEIKCQASRTPNGKNNVQLRAFPQYLLATFPDPFSLLHLHFRHQHCLPSPHLIKSCHSTISTTKHYFACNMWKSEKEV